METLKIHPVMKFNDKLVGKKAILPLEMNLKLITG